MQWQGERKEDATWEVLYNLQTQFLHLVGKVLWGGGGGGGGELLGSLLCSVVWL